MKKTKLLTSLAALGLVLSLGACNFDADINTGKSETSSEEHTHSYALTEHKDPTCTEEGYDVYTCSCGDTYTDTIDALGHDYGAYQKGEGDTHYAICSRCEDRIEGNCTYDLNKYGYDDSGSLHKVCDICGGLSTETTTATANSDGTYDYVADSKASLTSALSALSSVSLTDGKQNTITLTSDLKLDDGESQTEFDISASNVILTGGEAGVTLSSGHYIKVSGNNVTIKNITIDGSTTQVSENKYDHAIEISGNNVTLDGCTIIGGEAQTYTSAVLITLVPQDSETGKVTITDCNITGAFRGIYLCNQGNIDLYVSNSYSESTYAFNDTGASTSNFYFENSSLYGWTSYATSGKVTFTDCTLGFGDASQTYGFLRAYHGDTVFTDCLFRSFASRQIETENVLTNLYAPYVYVGHDNFMFGLGGTDVTYTLLNCQFEHVNDTEGSTDYKVETLTATNAGYLMSTDFDGTTHSACGFKFSTDSEAQLYSYSSYEGTLWTDTDNSSN